MHQRIGSIRSLAVAGAIGLAFSAAGIAAQEATPSATMEAGGGASHPAHIHNGGCDSPGDVVFPLSNVGMPAPTEGTPQAAPGPTTGARAIPVLVSVTQIDGTLDDVLSSPHSLNVHQSEDQIDRFIGCGDVGGTVMGDTLMFGLGPVNGSGASGVGLISENPDGGLNVVVYLVDGSGSGGGASATPSA